MSKSLCAMVVLLALSSMIATAQTPTPSTERDRRSPLTETGKIVGSRLGYEWYLVGETGDRERDQSIQWEENVWGGPAGDRLVIVRITVVDQSPADITGAWLAAQDVFDDQELLDRTDVDQEPPQLPCIDMLWGSRDDAIPAGTAVAGFKSLGVLCATSPSDFYVVVYSSYRYTYQNQFALVRSVLNGD